MLNANFLENIKMRESASSGKFTVSGLLSGFEIKGFSCIKGQGCRLAALSSNWKRM